MAPPRSLIAGERVELWLEMPEPPAPPVAPAGLMRETERTTPEEESAEGGGSNADWDVRPARVAAITPDLIVLQAGGWELADVPGAHAVVRRFDPDGLAEWEGEIGPQEVPSGLDFGALAAVFAAPEMTVIVRLRKGGGAGRLYQRRRSPRLPLGLTPIRLTPLGNPASGAPVPLMVTSAAPESGAVVSPVGTTAPSPATSMAASGHSRPEDDADTETDTETAEDESILPVARLTDVSATGAGIVVDYPLTAGTTVALEFQLPGESTPFAVRGRVIEPAVPMHGEVQPQPDGLPGFRRGIEFIGTTANREARRLAATLTRLLPRRDE